MSDKQYILTNRDLTFAESKGQIAFIEKGACGYILKDTNIIADIANLTENQAKEVIEELNKAELIGQTLILLNGRLRILNGDEFVQCGPPRFNQIRDGIF